MIRVNRITKDYGGSHPAIVNLQFCIQPGSVTVMVAPLAPGKAHCSAFSQDSKFRRREGSVGIAGAIPPFGILFQEPRRMPWLNVRQNVKFGFGPKRRQKSDRLADEILEQVGLRPFSRYYPRQLSGGMAQRVAIARALVKKPSLLDEPFSALDASTRSRLQEHLMQLWFGRPLTMLFVIHDIDEAVLLANHITVIKGSTGTGSAINLRSIYRVRKSDTITHFTRGRNGYWLRLRRREGVMARRRVGVPARLAGRTTSLFKRWRLGW
jgi:sulfonate transport system ATP-binding protein